MLLALWSNGWRVLSRFNFYKKVRLRPLSILKKRSVFIKDFHLDINNNRGAKIIITIRVRYHKSFTTM